MPQSPPNRRRRWFRFGLRTMFVVVTVLSDVHSPRRPLNRWGLERSSMILHLVHKDDFPPHLNGLQGDNARQSALPIPAHPSAVHM